MNRFFPKYYEEAEALPASKSLRIFISFVLSAASNRRFARLTSCALYKRGSCHPDCTYFSWNLFALFLDCWRQTLAANARHWPSENISLGVGIFALRNVVITSNSVVNTRKKASWGTHASRTRRVMC